MATKKQPDHWKPMCCSFITISSRSYIKITCKKRMTPKEWSMRKRTTTSQVKFSYEREKSKDAWSVSLEEHQEALLFDVNILFICMHAHLYNFLSIYENLSLNLNQDGMPIYHRPPSCYLKLKIFFQFLNFWNLIKYNCLKKKIELIWVYMSYKFKLIISPRKIIF